MLTEKLKSHFLNMYLIALSDSDFVEDEMKEILKIGADKGITEEEFHQIIMNPINVSFQIPNDTIEKIEYLFDFAKIIWADGKVDEYEKRSLFNFCKKFDFDEDVAKELTEWLLKIAEEDITHEQLHIEIDKLLKG